jgi:nitrate/nitrite transport system ATP-binding protein
MSAFVEIDHVDKSFPLASGGEYIALKNIELKIKQGEFISLIGHSGCGKSTLLNMVAGLDHPTHGGVVLDGREITHPGPDRMVVFQNYSLLPWKTVYENIALAVDRVLKHLPKGERRSIIHQNIDLVGLRHAAHKKPAELSGGMKQRVAIARALAIRPKVLLLDEPFGALDALTRGGMQDQLMQICKDHHVTTIMVTHDVDEALLLSDRVVMLTNGPEAHIGQILDVKIPRPRQRMDVVKHPSYYALRNELINFLNQQKRARKRQSTIKVPAVSRRPGVEKTHLDLGFLALTDSAPLIVAKEKGLFQKHGFESVTLHREPSWAAIAEGIAARRLDAAQMVSGMPLSLTLGLGGKAPLPIVTALVLSRNGNAITLSKELHNQGVQTLDGLRELLQREPDQSYTLGMVHPAAMHNLMLRYWLASGGINPDRDVNLVAVPPSQMLKGLKSGALDGYCVGEPWNSRAVQENAGFVVATDLDIWPSHPDKVLGLREDWAQRYPQTHLALVKALLEACEYCDDRRHRPEIVDLLCQPHYLQLQPEQIRPGFIDPYNYGAGKTVSVLRFNQFFFDHSTCPGRVEGLWMLTQLARWGLTPFPKNWVEILERVRRVDLYGEAARQLGLPDTEPDRNAFALFDGVVFNPDDPIDYLHKLSIHQPLRIEEIVIDPADSNAA